MSVANTSANSLLQTAASPQLRGQTVSLFMLAARGGMSLGGLLTGVTVTWLGVREALMVNGVLAMLAVAVLAVSWMGAERPVDTLAG
jgi:MFS family permease